MKNSFIILITLVYLIPQNIKAQNDGAAIAAGAGALLAIGAGIAAVKQMEERAELTATQWILSNNPEITSFSLKTLSFDGKKLKDMSETSVITYKIQEFIPSDKPELNGRKQVLFGFTSQGWINQYGIDFNKISWFLIDNDEWFNMMTSYVKVSSSESNDNTIMKTLREGKVVNKGVRVKSKLVIPFYKLNGDMYVVTDYSSKLKLIYNERSLGIFIKETGNLVQIGRGDIVEIHEFFIEN
jgi:hypothetical protein